MPRFEVEFYEAVSGKQPAKDFLLSLDKKMRAKMAQMISLLHIILTNGFLKKTQKTPRREIERAKKYRTDYLSRKKEYKK